ncbi:hypothetical protein HPB50_015413 [Hyalomma asiaticum]|uniref:Uncharacterized protein n=1 Tax=Hyalomma asiaticum TaxID=266040 RepID=A0ACB7SI93_HYAAI|nr:hypothetical protein HPB50_015413 [Hyalomma asiaticum]
MAASQEGMVDFSSPVIEKFWDAVQKHPSVYDTKRLHYRDVERKNNAWERIRVLSGLSRVEERLKLRKRLRDRYTGERKAIELTQRSGSGYVSRRMWEFYESMAFYKDCGHMRKTQLVPLHQNENAVRVQATTQSGELKWKRKVLYTKNGEEVACPVKTNGTYEGKIVAQVFYQGVSCEEKPVQSLAEATFVLEEARESPVCKGAMCKQEFKPLSSRLTAHHRAEANTPGRSVISVRCFGKVSSEAEKAGLKVDFITSDGATWNRKMWSVMGIKAPLTETKCSTLHPVDPTCKLHFLSDFPHLIKCLRNGLLRSDYETPERRVSLEFVRKALALDGCSVTLQAMHGITKSHTNPTNFEKMRSILTFQLFGEKVIHGLQLFKSGIEDACGDITATLKFFNKITAREGGNPTDLTSSTMPDKVKQDASAPDTSRIIDHLTALLERQATPADSFRLPLAVPAYEGHAEKKSVADFLQELQDYRDAQVLTNDTLLQRILPVTLFGRAPKEAWAFSRHGRWFEDTLLNHGDQNFWQSFRVSPTTFIYLVDVCQLTMERQMMNMREAVPIDKTVAIALYKLCSSAEGRTVTHLFDLGRSTVNVQLDTTGTGGPQVHVLICQHRITWKVP